ncbi:MAG TPA: creatininase family protein, partial [Longilinea sp.]|nr:creatininase family protein [Longilinea sp.]
MTQFFRYENLTWPEVAGLPRTTPLVIPLGTGYQINRLAEDLGRPDKLGILPALPFGWQSSGLAVEPSLLGTLVGNLLAGLREDGFSRAYVVTPPGVNLGLGEWQKTLPEEHPLGAAQPSVLPPEGEQGKVVLIPIGHVEQHGLHLPLSTDTVCIEAIGQGVMDAVPQLATSLPVFPYGVSTHRTAFAGTLNAGGRAFEDFWLDVIKVLAGRGFDTIYLMSGHGGNVSFLVNVVKYAGERHPDVFSATAWLYLSGPKGVAALEKHRQSKPGGMGHACELETSLLLHLHPELVHMERVVDETEFIATP